jgi:hypothetical protein
LDIIGLPKVGGGGGPEAFGQGGSPGPVLW